MPHAPILCRAPNRRRAGARWAAALAAGAALLTTAPSAAAGTGGSGVSVAVHAGGGGTVREGEHVSYAIEVHNTTDRPIPDAVVTQQLPPNLAFLTASPAARREGRHLTWTLDVPAHGIARITMTGAAGRPHHLGSRRPTADQALAHGTRHGQITTTVCVSEDPGASALACATGRNALRANRMPRWQPSAAAAGLVVALLGTGVAGLRTWRRRRVRRVPAT